MFLPTTKEEMKKLNWDYLDVIVVTGDTYIDSSYIGAAIIGKVLYKAGYKVGIVAQPNIENDDIARLGEPRLFWGVTAGSVDSMVANYTALKKKRRSDDFTPGGVNNKRPDRATIAYSNLIRKYFKNTKPIVLGGIEASLRRIAHYDYWDDKVRRSILFDAKADILVYGMGEKTILELAERMENNKSIAEQRGICYIAKEPIKDYIVLSDYELVKNDKVKFIDMFNSFYQNNSPQNSSGLCQKQDTRYLIHNPPNFYPTTEELDGFYGIQFERDVHPYYKKDGIVKALDTIKYSITTHRGCYGECNFCAIAIHQGREIQERSINSIIKEAEEFTHSKDFKGNILDVGGPTANMYGIECTKKREFGSCKEKRCLFPEKCNGLKIDHTKQINMLKEISLLKGIKKVFVASGIRYDMIIEDKKSGDKYLTEIVKNHVSGQMKIAPEHTENRVLQEMGKPGCSYLTKFVDSFYEINNKIGKKQFLTYYFIAAHPGCTDKDMKKLKDYASKVLHTNPEQVQVFTPTPSTYSTLMYYTEMDPFTKEKIFVEKGLKEKERQKEILCKEER